MAKINVFLAIDMQKQINSDHNYFTFMLNLMINLLAISKIC